MPKHLVMCAPDCFDVSYTINPWMKPDQWAREGQHLSDEARAGWRQLVATFRDLGAAVSLVPPVAGLPDMVFTANAAVVLDRIALIARFRHPERQGESAHFERFFRALVAQGHLDRVEMMDEGVSLEGAGDCVWDEARQCFWLGTGPRSDPAAAETLRRIFGQVVRPLELVNPRFYHMDTALCPLSGGEALVVREAFSATGFAEITRVIGEANIIEVPSVDAARLSANAVCLGRDLVLCAASDALDAAITARGYRLHRVPIAPFLLSGGSAFCLTLAIDRRSRRWAQAA